MKNKPHTDHIGIFASTACAAHCLICTFLPWVLGGLGLAALGHDAEWFFVIFAITTSIVALAAGYRRHRSMKIVTIFLAGVTILLLSRAVEEFGHDGHHDHHVHHDHEHDAHDAHDDLEHHDDHEDGHEQTAVENEDHDDGAIDFHVLGAILSVFAALTLVTAHWLNIRQRRRCLAGCC